nr:hypothetical protein [uncultured Devosia sp.]
MKDSSDRLERADGRRKFVVYLDPKLIHAIKIRALNEDRHAYELVEELLTQAIENSAK